MTNSLNITLHTLTPLWTGGVDQTCDRLHETGLIGSLRWWYEALVRGLGGYACDPTEHTCTFDEEKYRKSTAREERQRLREAGLCDACQLFGATGWARRFRLQLSDGEKLFNGKNVLIPSGRVHQSKHGSRAGGWFVFSESRRGDIAFKLVSLRDADLRPIETILALIGQHASLGPKGSNGYGVIKVENVSRDLSWVNLFGNQNPARNNALPDFRDFFFARFQFDEPQNSNWWQQIEGIRQAASGQLDDGRSPRPLRQASQEMTGLYSKGILPIAPAIRNWLRYQWKPGLTLAEAHFIFGEARAVCPHCYQPGFSPDQKNQQNNSCPGCKQSFKKGAEIPTTASKIFVSYAYRIDENRWEFRIWGWLPCEGVFRKKRDAFLNDLKTQLTSADLWTFVFNKTGITPQMTEWHSLTCAQTDGRAYLSELLGGAQ